MSEPGASGDISSAELREAVARRVAEGQYPPNLDADLQEHFQHVLINQDRSPTALELLLHRVETTAAFGPDRIPYISSIPLGSSFHRTIGRIVARQTNGVLFQMREFALAVRDFLATLTEQLPRETSIRANSDHLHARVDSLLDQLSRATREARFGEFRPNAETTFHPAFSQEAFMSRFRGSRAAILDRYADIADRLQGCEPVLDIGTGRGEMLELLKERGIRGVGVDLDSKLAANLRAGGYQVEVADALEYLESCPDGSFGGIFAGQLIEHLEPQRTIDLIVVAKRKLRRGGLLILETVNPDSLYVLSHSYFLDPTHVKPVPPRYLEFVCRELGFAAVEIQLRAPVPSAERMEALSETSALDPVIRDALNRNFERLNRLVFADQDYAIIATC